MTLSSVRAVAAACASEARERVAVEDSVAAAEDAGLYSITDARPSISRRRRGRGWTRPGTTATVVRFLDESLIRIGSEECAEENESFGLTTLRDEHAAVGRSVARSSYVHPRITDAYEDVLRERAA